MSVRVLWSLLLFLGAMQYSFSQNVSGVVKDADGIPLPGVTIQIKGESKGTQTDLDGKYSLKVEQGKTLIFTYVGMAAVEKKVGTSSKIDVTLSEDAQLLKEVVVTGITSTDKRLFTGASDKLSAADVKLDGVPDISRALEGRSAGVVVQNVTGTFGASPKIRVRGASSIFGSSKPLWVVDGVILEDAVELGADDLSSGDPATIISSAIAGLNPEDIESYEILKDGSATSIYGARAMAGVVVVTTKRGKAGESNFTYSNETTYRFIPTYDNFDILNSQEQMSVLEELREAGWLNYADVATNSSSGVYGKMYSLLNQLDANGNFLLPNTPEAKAAYLRQAEYRNTNWFKELFVPTLMQNHSVSMSSGNDKGSYYASMSALIDPGWTLASKVNRYTANFNSSFKLSNKLTLNVLGNASFRKQTSPGTVSRSTNLVDGKVKRDFDINPFSYAMNTSRTLDPNEYYVRNYAPFNIKQELANNYMDYDVTDLRFQTDLRYKFTPEIEFTLLGAVKYQNTNVEHHATEFSNQANAFRAMGTAAIRDRNPLLYKDPDDDYALPISILPEGGIYRRTTYGMTSYDFRATTSYKKEFDGKHIVNFYLGTESNATNRQRNVFRGWGLQYSMGEIPYYIYESFKRNIEDNDAYYSLGNTRGRNAAFFANATYSYKHKYTINGTYRYEGTNKLGRSRSARWLPTWNISGSWNAHSEDFFDKQNVASHLTFKASYSLTADRGPEFVTNSLVDIRSSNPWRPFSALKESSLYINALENSELTYEKKKELNIGVDVGFLEDRITLVADWYQRNNHDLIGHTITQGIGGQIVKYGNVAAMKSNGFEFAIKTTNVKTKDFTWTTDFVYAKTKNEVTKLQNRSRVMDLLRNDGFPLEGYAARSMFSFDFRGLNNEGLPTFLNEKGEVTVQDINFQEREKLSHLIYSGTTEPTDTGSFGNIFQYKNVKLNVFMTYAFGNVVRLNPSFSSLYSDMDANTRAFQNRWVVPGDEHRTTVPVIATRRHLQNYTNLARAYNAYDYSTERIAKGDFIRLKEVSLSYDFDKDLVQRLKLKSLMMKLQATNLFLLYADKKLNGQDPEFMNSGGVAAPIAKQITFTLRLGL